MPPMKIEQHVETVLSEIQKFLPMTEEERNNEINCLRTALKMIQNDASKFAMAGEKRLRLTPAQERKQAFVEDYLEALKPSDILNDDPSPYHSVKDPTKEIVDEFDRRLSGGSGLGELYERRLLEAVVDERVKTELGVELVAGRSRDAKITPEVAEAQRRHAYLLEEAEKERKRRLDAL
jgi:hypothetical protein